MKINTQITGIEHLLQNIHKMETKTVILAEKLIKERGRTAAKDAKNFLDASGIGKYRNTGQYRKDIKSSFRQKNMSAYVGSFYKGKRVSRISHLLEFGHRTSKGTMTREFPHLKPAFNKNLQPFIEEMQKALFKGIKSAEVKA